MTLATSKRGDYFNLPNYLTLGRVLLIPVVAVLIARISPDRNQLYNLWMGLIASFVYIVAGVSDLVDGYYARKFNINSVFGKYFDPLADKLMFLTAVIMLVPLGRVPAWMAAVFLARELTITALRGVATAEGLILPADEWGKKKTVLQNISAVALMIYYPIWGTNLGLFGMWVLWMALLMTVGSGINYSYQFSKVIMGRFGK